MQIYKNKIRKQEQKFKPIYLKFNSFFKELMLEIKHLNFISLNTLSTAIK